jgi:hypothetical protein
MLTMPIARGRQGPYRKRIAHCFQTACDEKSARFEHQPPRIKLFPPPFPQTLKNPARKTADAEHETEIVPKTGIGVRVDPEVIGKETDEEGNGGDEAVPETFPEAGEIGERGERGLVGGAGEEEKGEGEKGEEETGKREGGFFGHGEESFL